MDHELKAIITAAAAISGLTRAERVRALDYLTSRYQPEPLVLVHDDESDQEEAAPWPTVLDDASAK